MFIDSHTHFDLILEESDQTEEQLLQALAANNITHTVQISIDCNSFEWANAFSKKNEKLGILFSVGIHPSSSANEKELTFLKTFLETYYREDGSKRLFGIGECGLDYYRLRQPKEIQQASFAYQIELAKQYNIPLIIHSREAMDDTLKLLQEATPITGIMHCFPGNRIDAKQALDLGLYISYAGNVTFKKATNLHESAQYVPLDRLLVETDAPFLAPVPNRGKKNLPHYVIHTYQFLADLRKQPLEKICDAVKQNFNCLRGL